MQYDLNRLMFQGERLQVCTWVKRTSSNARQIQDRTLL